MFGVCKLSIVPCRKEPSDKSEMVTQLLFGEIYEVVGNSGNWLNIITDHDNYECWIGIKQHFVIASQLYNKIKDSRPFYTNDFVQTIFSHKDKIHFPIVIGSLLPLYEKPFCYLGDAQFDFEGDIVSPISFVGRKKLIENAYIFLNAPYLWGGRSPFGIDCSGFTQMVYRLSGINLPRDARQQVLLGNALSFVEEALPGDLAFFDNAEGNITHVGIMLDNKQIIHASGRVRIDSLDHQGIYDQEGKKYTHNLRVIKNII